ncbi:ATP-binding protein, partial [Alistipes putredinis]|uniref:ATP-binding protein n=1 Tax=Alistipes putredinis TaxID=28117 RepID=UPI003AF1AB94
QLPTDNWYDAIGDPTVADAIMDRIIHTAHRIELTGESVRKMAAYRGKKTKIIITPSVKTF